MSRHDARSYASQFAGFVKGLGFRAFIAESGDYGFITDTEGTRVLSFSFSDGLGNLGGNYWPPSRESGTGWRMDTAPHELRCAEDVRRVLYAHPPEWCRKGWKRFTTLADHLGMYGPSSRYTEI